eukprot:132646-Pelagomonas_calceolata.AAC.6
MEQGRLGAGSRDQGTPSSFRHDCCAGAEAAGCSGRGKAGELGEVAGGRRTATAPQMIIWGQEHAPEYDR